MEIITELNIKVKTFFEDDISNENTVRYLIEQDLLDNGWDIESIDIVR